MTAAKKDDKTITLNLSTESLNGGGVLQGYEILRKDSGTAGEFKSIAFTSEGTYDDVIGSANHRTFTYKVVAYDTLGNVVGAAESQEMRIAYDKTVGADQYDITRNEDNSVTIALKKETAVSGLKISGTKVTSQLPSRAPSRMLKIRLPLPALGISKKITRR